MNAKRATLLTIHVLTRILLKVREGNADTLRTGVVFALIAGLGTSGARGAQEAGYMVIGRPYGLPLNLDSLFPWSRDWATWPAAYGSCCYGRG